MLSAQSAWLLSTNTSNSMHEIIEMILQRILTTIRIRAEHKQKECEFEIPVWIAGYPCYDINRVTASVIRVLTTLGYRVREFQHNLHITWRHAITHETPTEPKSPVRRKPTQQKKTREKKTIVTLDF